MCIRSNILFRCGRLHPLYLLTDDSQRSGVGHEDAVQALRLLGGVVGIVVAHLPLLVLRLGKSTPAPEVAASEVSTLFGIVGNEREDILVVAVAPVRRGVEGKLEAVAGIAELLHHQRFVQRVADGQVLVDVRLGVLTGLWQVLDERVGLGPTPVVGPQVDIAVVDIGVGTDAGPAAEVVLTAPRALAADGDEVVLV